MKCHLDYATQVWSPAFTSLKVKIENVQRRQRGGSCSNERENSHTRTDLFIMLRQLLNIKLMFKYDMYKDKDKQQKTQTRISTRTNTEDRRQGHHNSLELITAWPLVHAYKQRTYNTT